MCSLSKEHSILSREKTQSVFFLRVMPLFRLRLFILYQALHSRALAPAFGSLVYSAANSGRYRNTSPKSQQLKGNTSNFNPHVRFQI